MKTENKVLNIRNKYKLEEDVNRMICLGWQVTRIETEKGYKVFMEKESILNSDIPKNNSSIRFLLILTKKRLIEIAKELKIAYYSSLEKPELIDAISIYKKKTILEIYETLTIQKD